MSYPVRVVVKHAVRETLTAVDEVRLALCQDPVLANPEALELLKEQLGARGFEARDGTPSVFVRALDDGTEVVWDLAAQEVVIHAAQDRTVSREGSLTAHGDAWRPDDRTKVERELREQAASALKDQLALSDAERANEEAALQTELAARLEAQIAPVEREIAAIQEGFYRAWLTREAAKLGNVTSVCEREAPDGSTYELTITVDASPSN